MFSRQLEDAVNAVKTSRERRHEYMLWSLRNEELRDLEVLGLNM